MIAGQALRAAEPAASSAAAPNASQQRSALLAEMREHSNLSHKLLASGDAKQAVSEADAALAIARQVDRDNLKLLVTWIDFAASTHERAADFDGARKLRTETLSLQQKRFAADDWHVTDARVAIEHLDRLSHLTAEQRSQLVESDKLFGQAGSLSSRKKYYEAILPAKKAYDSRKEILGDKDAYTATAANRLGFLYNQVADYAEAAAWSQRAVDMRKVILGTRHPDYAISLSNLALSYYWNADYAHAEPWIRQTIEVQKAVLGEKDPDYLDSLGTLCNMLRKSAETHEQAEDFVLARKEREEVLSTETERFGKSDWHVTDARLAVAHLDRLSQLSSDARRELNAATDALSKSMSLNEQKKYAEAIADAKKTYDSRSKILGDDDPQTAVAVHWLGYVYGQSGDPANAKLWKQKAVDIRRRILGENHPEYALSLNNLGYYYFFGGDYANAEPLFRQTLEIRRKVLGEKNTDTVQSLSSLTDVLERLADSHENSGDFAAAQKEREEILANRKKQYIKSNWHVTDAQLALAHVELMSRTTPEQRKQLAEAERLSALSSSLENRRSYADAIPLARKVLDIRSSVLGDEDPSTITATHWLGYLYNLDGDYPDAETWNQRAADLRKRVLGQHHPDYARSLNNLAFSYQCSADYERAEPLFRQSVAIRSALFGENDSDTRTTLKSLTEVLEHLATKHEQAEDFDRARDERTEILADKTKLYGISDWRVTDARLALAHVERLSGLSHSDLRQVLDAITSQDTLPTLRSQGKYTDAIELATDSYQSLQKILGDDDTTTEGSAVWIGAVYDASGDFAQAETWKKKCVDTTLRMLGEHHPDYGFALESLGNLYGEMGNYVKAEPLLRQAIEIRKAAVGEDRSYSITLNNLALLYDDMADEPKAEELYRQSIALARKLFGIKSATYATCLNNLALVYMKNLDYAKAEPLLKDAVDINKELYGDNHPVYALNLANLALLYFDMGKFSQAEPLYSQALAIDKDALGEKHPNYATLLNSIALLDQDTGNIADAESLFQKVVDIRKQVLGEKHPDYAFSLCNLGVFYEFTGNYSKAASLTDQALQIERDELDATAGIQSEFQQLRMSQTGRTYLTYYLSVSGKANLPAADVYAKVLPWKGLVSARQQSMRRLREEAQSANSPKLTQLFNDLAAASRQLSNQSQVVPASGTEKEHQQLLTQLSDRVENLQQQLAAESSEFRHELDQQRRTPDDIRHAMPAGTALVDLMEYSRMDAPRGKAKQPSWTPSLVAFIVRPDKPIERIELGPVAPVNTAIESWRKTFGRSSATPDPAQELRKLVWSKVEPSLAGAKTVLLSPDGETANFPWAALPGKQPETYLVEDIAIAVVPIPRLLPELLAENSKPLSSGAASETMPASDPSLLVIGDVNFDADPGRVPLGALAQSAPIATRGGKPFHWPALPGTRTEIVSIADSFEQQFPDAKIKKLRDANATKAQVVSSLDKYRYIHFATHGYFASDEVKSASAAGAGRDANNAALPSVDRQISGYHPGLLSGLVLAGANLPAVEGKDDGILTALEVGGLNLSHVDLATLSACETGLGKVAGGEGILGLQRAFQISGAKSVMATLWKIHDDASRSLMIDFYENLWRKKMSKVEALRQAQLTMLRDGIKRGLELPDDQPPDKAHRLPPYYWAPFVLSGDWR